MAFSLSLYPLPLEVVGLPSFLPIPSVCLGGAEGKKGTTRSIAKVNTDPGGQLEASVQLARQLHNILYLMQDRILQTCYGYVYLVIDLFGSYSKLIANF